MELLNFFAQNKKGDVVPSATVYVYAAGTTNTVDIYDRSGGSKGNPFNADGNGFVEFRVADGEYDVRVISGDSEYTLTVQAGDVVALDSEVQAIKSDASTLLATSPSSGAERSLGDWVEGITYTFDSVAAMKADTRLREGDVVHVVGYKAPGDRHSFQVVAAGGTSPDEISYVALYDATLIAEAVDRGDLSIYVSEAGNDDQSGLSESDPVRTLTQAAEIASRQDYPVYNIYIGPGRFPPGAHFRGVTIDATVSPRLYIRGEPVNRSTGQVDLELSEVAGTFQVGEAITGQTSGSAGQVTEQGDLFVEIDASGEIQIGETIEGATSGATATVIAVNAVPTSIIDGSLGADKNGISITDCPNVELIDVKCEGLSDYDKSGVRLSGEGLLTLTNYHSKECYRGLFALSNTRYIMRRSVLTGGNRAIHELFGVVRSFVGSPEANRNVIRNATYGVFSKEHCTGHLDQVSITGCDTAIFGSRSVTYNASDARLVKNGRPFVLRNGSFIVPLRIDYGFETTEANDEPWYIDATSSMVSNESGAENPNKFPVSERIIGFRCPATPDSHTGTTGEHVFPAVTSHRRGNLSREGMYYRAVVSGIKVGSMGTAAIRFKWGGATVSGPVIPAGYAGAFSAEFWLVATSPTTQVSWSELRLSGEGVVRAANDRAYNTTVAEFDLSFAVQLSDASDEVQIKTAHVYGLEAPEQGG